jgi:putative ATP-dependent endonuclease of OLD family
VIELEQLIKQNSRDHTIWAIEEPEAHLHPHLQRLVYGNFLRSRSKENDDGKTTTILMTTHSPHIVSVAPLKTLLIIRKTSDGKSSEGVSAASSALDEKETADLERYIDVTRGEILFAKGVLLVEGDAEEFLLPVVGEKLDYDFDKLGITVCSVSGTNFLPYVKLLGQNGLNIPYAVLTDFDPQSDGSGLGQKRIINLLSNVMDATEYAKYKEDALLKMAPKFGYFMAENCLEIDLFKSGQHKSMCQTMIELTESGAADKRAKEWFGSPDGLDESLLLKDIIAISKGRYAQRLATNITSKSCPDYIKKAIKYVADKCQ